MEALKTHEAFHENDVIGFHVNENLITEEYQGQPSKQLPP